MSYGRIQTSISLTEVNKGVHSNNTRDVHIPCNGGRGDHVCGPQAGDNEDLSRSDVALVLVRLDYLAVHVRTRSGLSQLF